jgi:hypothetical protein
MDLQPVIDAVVVGTLVSGIIAAGAVKMGPTVAKWAVNKLVSMFGR